MFNHDYFEENYKELIVINSTSYILRILLSINRREALLWFLTNRKLGVKTVLSFNRSSKKS